MRKILLLLIFTMFCSAQNLYYIDYYGAQNLGKVKKESDVVYNEEGLIQNEESYYRRGKKILKQEYDELQNELTCGETYNITTDNENHYIPKGLLNGTENEERTIIRKNGEVKLFIQIDEILPNYYSRYLIIRNNLLYSADGEQIDTNGVDMKTLKQIDNCVGGRYFKDKDNVYVYAGEETKDGSGWRIYFKKIGNLKDYKNIEILTEFYAKDDDAVYYNGKVIKGADTKTYKIIKLSWRGEPCTFVLGYDKNGIYYEDKKISDIKLSGKITIIDGTLFKDTKNIYNFIPSFDSEDEGTSKIKVLKLPVYSKYIMGFFEYDNVIANGVKYDDNRDVIFNVVEKEKDFKWLTKNGVFQNGNKIYKADGWGVIKTNIDVNTLEILENDERLSIVKDKTGYYVSEYVEHEGQQLLKIKDVNFDISKDLKYIGNGIFNNPKTKEYYHVDSTKPMKLKNINNISKTFSSGYFIGE